MPINPPMKIRFLLSALFMLLFFCPAAQAQEKTRVLTVQELSELIAIDPAYKNEVSPDGNGNYVDHNSADYYTLVKGKAEAAKRPLLNYPTDATEANQLFEKLNSISLPDVILTGNETNDISRYKQTMQLWILANRDNLKYLDPETQGFINAEDYISLYSKQVMLNHVKTN